MNEKFTRDAIIVYCAKIGTDPLLVQGAGGNVSWKEKDALWVKASGTWLAEATEKDIFVPVDLTHLRHAISNNDFSVIPQLRNESSLRPSIETLLHALMPQRVVIHVHAIEALAHLVRADFQAAIRLLLDDSIPWVIVDYFKPGAPLAAAVNSALQQKPDVKVIFLRNHGVVVGGESIKEVQKIIGNLTKNLRVQPADIYQIFDSIALKNRMNQYAPIADAEIHQLALNPEFYKRLSSDWVLYPDHVVFLGPKAHVYSNWQMFRKKEEKRNQLPELVFIENEGVYVTPAFNKAKQLQLRCYYDVIARQQPGLFLCSLKDTDIAELLNWDAEQYRINLAK